MFHQEDSEEGLEREFQDQQKEWFDKHVFKKQSTLFIICNQKIDNIRRNIKMRGIREGLLGHLESLLLDPTVE